MRATVRTPRPSLCSEWRRDGARGERRQRRVGRAPAADPQPEACAACGQRDPVPQLHFSLLLPRYRPRPTLRLRTACPRPLRRDAGAPFSCRFACWGLCSFRKEDSSPSAGSWGSNSFHRRSLPGAPARQPDRALGVRSEGAAAEGAAGEGSWPPPRTHLALWSFQTPRVRT